MEYESIDTEDDSIDAGYLFHCGPYEISFDHSDRSAIHVMRRPGRAVGRRRRGRGLGAGGIVRRGREEAAASGARQQQQGRE